MDLPKAKRFTLDSEGRLLDEHGRELDVARTEAFSLKVNQKHQKNKQHRERFKANSKKDRDFARSFFFDTNLPKKRPGHERISALRFEESKPQLVAELVPEVEWWDKTLVGSLNYHQDLTDTFLREVAAQLVRSQPSEDLSLLKGIIDQKVQDLTIEYSISQITDVVQHPDPIDTIPINTTSHSVPMHLTDKERKKLNRQKRAERLKDIRDMVKLGLVEAAPAKMKLATMMKVMAKEVALDPSKTEQEILKIHNERMQTHLKRNDERKLSKEQKQERTMRKLRRDSARESRVAVFRMQRLVHAKNLFKITKNAKQLALVGCCLRPPQPLPSIVIVEGGKRALKFFKRLCLHRIDWSLDDGDCHLAWEAEIADPSFRLFTMKEFGGEQEVRLWLAKHNAEHLWDLVRNWQRPVED